MGEPWEPDDLEPPRRGSRWTPIVIIGCAFALYWVMTRPAPALEGWRTDYPSALAEAEAGNRKVLLAFHMQGCPPCNLMIRQVLNTAQVKAALEGFIPVRVDADRDAATPARYAVQGTPTYIVTDPGGTPLAMTAGYVPVDAFVAFLKQASARTAAAASEESGPPAAP
jgi:thioredoxin-related protein